MSRACTMRRSKLEAVAAGRDDARVLAHVKTCAACQTTLAELRASIAAIGTLAMPAPSPAKREQEIRHAITAGLAAPARAKRAWLAIGAGLAAAGAVAVLVVFLGRSRPATSEPVIAQGALSAPIALDTLVDVVGQRDAVVQLADRTTLTLAPATRIARRDRAASRWELAHGKMALAVTKRGRDNPLQVITEEARVEVVGTRFTVERHDATTRVEVSEGVVRVVPRTGDVVMLSAGQAWSAAPPAPPPPPALDAGIDAPAVDASIAVAPSPPTHAPPSHAPPPPRHFDAAVIRSTIRAGKLADARKLIEAGRQAYRDSAPTLAELGILAAEADLAERQTKRAIDKYLAVVRDFPATAQAEQALFAAAQLALDRPDSGYRAKALLEDYLQTYPRGQFRKDAERLLESLQHH